MRPIRISLLFALAGVLCSAIAFSQVTITSVTPNAGSAGSSVTITGNNFSATAPADAVFFGGVRATVTAASTTSLTVTVPSGAGYQPITVTTGGHTSVAPTDFDLTFTGGVISASSLAPAVSIPTKDYPYAVVAGDFDGDGKTDLALATGAYPYAVSIYRNTGSAGVISFAAPVDIAVGTSPYAVAMGDLDGDGKPDLAVTNTADGTVTILRNTCTPGSISFTSAGNFTVDAQPFGVAIGDLDGDGKPDVAVSSMAGNTVSLLRNTTTGSAITFAAKTDLTTRAAPLGIAIRDLDQDGKADLVVCTKGNYDFDIFINQSTTGALSFQRTFFSWGPGITPLVADLDGDGKPEITVSGLGTGGLASIGIFRNITSVPGNYTAANAVQLVNPDMVWLTLADMDGDGKADICCSLSGGGIAVYKNQGTPGAVSFAPAVNYTAGSNPLAIAAGDFDGDGWPDLVMTDQGSTALLVLRNIGANPAITSITPTGGTGSPDTVIGQNFTGATAVTFAGQPAASFTLHGSDTIIAVIGLAGGGHDVTVTTPQGTASLAGFVFVPTPVVTSFTPTSGGYDNTITLKGHNFSGASAVTFGGAPASAYTVVDSTTITAVVGGGATGSVAVTTLGGTATLPGFTYYHLGITALSPVSGPVGTTVTITGQGFGETVAGNIVYFGNVRATVLTASATRLTAIVPPETDFQPVTVTTGMHTAYSSQPFRVTIPRGGVLDDSTFAHEVQYPIGTAGGHVEMDDIDGDGKPDLVVTQGHNVTAFRNISTADSIIFAPATDLYTSTANATSFAMLDMDGDGKLDLAVCDVLGYVYIYRNASTPGHFSFTNVGTYQVGAGCGAIVAADFDGDGRPEVAVSCNWDNDVVLLVNTTDTVGNITFDNVLKPLILSNYPEGISVGDVDGDGRPDILIANNYYYLPQVSIARNTSKPGSFSFAPSTTINTGDGDYPALVLCGDVNGDAKPDVIVEIVGGMMIYPNTSSPGNISVGTPVVQQLTLGGDMHLADMDGDGKEDLVVSDGHSAIGVMRNTGVGGSISFAPVLSYPTGPNYSSSASVAGMIACDANGDGKPDLLASTGSSAAVFQNRMAPAIQPTVLSFTPATATQGVADTLRGSGFAGASNVTFGNTPAASMTILSDTVMVAVIGHGASGSVSVTTAAGMGTRPGFTYVGPLIGSYAPSIADLGMTDTIRGVGFNGVTAVSFGGVPAAAFTIHSDTLITAVLGTGATGALSVTDAQGKDSATGFVYGVPPAPPVITSASPLRDTLLGTVTLKGAHFQQVEGVTFGGVPALGYTVVDSTTIQAVVGQGASGNIVVTTATGAGLLGGFTYLPPAPEAFFFTPAYGSAGQTITIGGRNFTGVTGISFGGVPAAGFTVIDSNAIQAVLGQGATGDLVVGSANGSDTLGGFIYTAQNITITSFSPASATTGQQVTLKGTGLAGAQAVQLGGVAAGGFTVIDDNTLVVTVGLGATGPIQVQGVQGTAGIDGFTFLPNHPVITSFSPASGRYGDKITILGAHFVGVTSVSFGGVPASGVLVADTSTMYAYVGYGATGAVKVGTAYTDTSLGGFTYIPFAPVVTGFTPDTGSAGSVVTIHGQFWDAPTAVSFGTMPAASFTWIDSSTIKAVVGAGATGSVTVSNSGGSSSLPGFTFTGPFTLTSFTGAAVTSGNQLSWTVQNEDTVSGYTLMGGPDSVNLQLVTLVPATHPDSVQVEYDYTDAKAPAGLDFYQLYITCISGFVQKSAIIQVGAADIHAIHVTPNPASGQATVVYPTSAHSATLRLIDMKGNVALTQDVAPATNQAVLDVSGLQPGIYILYWSDGSDRSHTRLMVQ